MGVGYSFRYGELLHTTSLGLDIHGPILQRNRVPGFYANYSCDFLIAQKLHQECDFRFYGGAGVDFGYGDDLKHPVGLFLGPMADLRLEFSSTRVPVRLSVVFRPTLALHCYKEGKQFRMGIYSVGLMNSLIPRIGISYDFEYSPKPEPLERKSDKVFTYGIETSYIALFEAYNHTNYISDEGGRVDLVSQSYHYNTVARVLVFAGCNIGHHFNISLYGGYQGASKKQKLIPMILRPTVVFGPHEARGRALAYAGCGTGFNIGKTAGGLPVFGELGGGYRLSLFGSVKVEFLAALCCIYTHPGSVPDAAEIRRSNQLDIGLSLGTAIRF